MTSPPQKTPARAERRKRPPATPKEATAPKLRSAPLDRAKGPRPAAAKRRTGADAHASSASSKPPVSEVAAHVRTIVAHLFGGRPKRVAPLGGGLTNHVYAVSHAEGDFVVRLGGSPAKVKEYLKEQWAMARAREAGVPTAEILEVGADLVPMPYMVARKVSGSEATHHPERQTILKEMGRLTALIHGIETSSFGHTFDWSHNTLTRRDTWRDYLRSELKVAEKIEILEEHKALDADAMRRLRAVWREAEGWTDKPVLNHGDMRLKNVMVDEAGAVTAVIDWEFCSSNIAPYWDLSIALHDLSIDAKQSFLDGYGVTEARVREIAPVLKAINLVNYAPHVDRVARSGDERALERLRTRLSGALDLYAL